MDIVKLEQKLKQIVSDQLGTDIKTITNDSNFVEDLGADSLDALELLMAVEEAFSLNIDDETAERLENFGQLLSYVNQQTQ
jgi:acyl carrier protein